MTAPTLITRNDAEALLFRGRNPVRITATGDLYAQGASVARPGLMTSITLTGGADAATAILKDGGSSGTIICEIKAGILETVTIPFPWGCKFDDGVHATITGTTPSLISVGHVDDDIS